MSQIMRYTFRLFGPRKGKTVTINGHKFVNGEYAAVIGPHNAANLIRVLSYYAAYAKGTPEYDAALAKEQEEEANGADEVHEGSVEGSAAEVHGDGGPDGSGPAEVPADDGEGAAEDAAPGTGSDSDGDGHEGSGVRKFEDGSGDEPREPASVGSEAVKEAVLKLDPENDDHWVNTGAHKGKPKLAAVEEAYGKAGLTRDDLEAALPGWTRDNALEKALEDLE